MNPMIANPIAVAMAIRWNSVEKADKWFTWHPQTNFRMLHHLT